MSKSNIQSSKADFLENSKSDEIRDLLELILLIFQKNGIDVDDGYASSPEGMHITFEIPVPKNEFCLLYNDGKIDFSKLFKSFDGGDEWIFHELAAIFPSLSADFRNRRENHALFKYLNDSNRDNFLEMLELIVRRFTGDGVELVYPDEIHEDQIPLFEGAVRTVLVNQYERNQDARDKAIAHYGCRCCVCGFDFEKKYGSIGRNFIHVHHVIDMSLIGHEYEINPIEHLRPVCPNCHSMLHTERPAMAIDKLRAIIRERQGE